MHRAIQRVAFACLCLGFGVGGCAEITPDPDPQPGLRNLGAIDFANDVPQGTDPITVDLDDGSLTFAGGTAGTRRILPLYFNDAFAWNLNGGAAEVSFENLDVKVVRFYFAHQGAEGATLTAWSAEGTELGTANSFAATNLGDANAIFEIAAGESTIARLAIASPDGVIASLDHLILSVPE